jgi:hypothetical protein
MMKRKAPGAAGLLLVVACGDGAAVPGDAGLADAARLSDGGSATDATNGCPRVAAPADRARKVVVSHPYDATGAPANEYEVLELSADGELALGGPRFELGRATDTAIAFTVDGEVGVVVQTDGTLGVFRFDASGAPQVVHTAYSSGFYADSVVFDPVDPSRLYVLDNEHRDVGGGVYALRVGCDGALADAHLVVPAKLPAALVFPAAHPARALLAAADALDSASDRDVLLFDWAATPALLAAADAFPDDDAIRSAATVTADGDYLLVGDNSAFSSVPNRVGVVAIGASSLTPAQILSPLEDPFAIVASPFATGGAIVVSGFGDAIFELGYSPAADPPFAVAGELAYVGPAPQLPGKAVLINRGSLTGLVLVAENLGVRRVRFSADGGVADLGVTARAEGLENIVGAIGVQP